MKAAVLLLVACGSSTPAPTSTPGSATTSPVEREARAPHAAPSLDGLAVEQRCAVTEARALPCMDELFIAIYRASFGDEPEGPVGHSDADEARVIHQTNCLGGEDYTRALVTCWHEPSCDALAACVGKLTPSLK